MVRKVFGDGVCALRFLSYKTSGFLFMYLFTDLCFRDFDIGNEEIVDREKRLAVISENTV